MAWHISKVLYEKWRSSQEQEEVSLGENSLDGNVSAPSNGNPTPQAYLSPDRMKAFSRLSRFGMTCEHLTDDRGEDLLTWYREASRAKTSALQERVTDLTGSEAASGRKWSGSLAKYDPDTRSWRTAQCSLLGGLTAYSGTWPRWGTMRNGEFWERTMQVLLIEGKGSGYWPTPKASQDGTSPKTIDMVRKGLAEMSLARIMYMPEKWPANTPSGNWPTPTCADAFTDKLKSSQQTDGSMHSVNLSQAVKMWPTPIAHEGSNRRTKPTPAQERGEAGMQLSGMVGGQLNPDWVEWLMGWPVGWTDLRPLGTDRFHMWPHLHGIPSTNASKAIESNPTPMPTVNGTMNTSEAGA